MRVSVLECMRWFGSPSRASSSDVLEVIHVRLARRILAALDVPVVRGDVQRVPAAHVLNVRIRAALEQVRAELVVAVLRGDEEGGPAVLARPGSRPHRRRAGSSPSRGRLRGVANSSGVRTAATVPGRASSTDAGLGEALDGGFGGGDFLVEAFFASAFSFSLVGLCSGSDPWCPALSCSTMAPRSPVPSMNSWMRSRPGGARYRLRPGGVVAERARMSAPFEMRWRDSLRIRSSQRPTWAPWFRAAFPSR